MVVLCTSETEVVSAIAMYCGYYPSQVLTLDRAFDGVFAVGSGAPLEVLSIVDVGSCEEYLVSVDVSSALSYC
jgi:hypothetical protein